MGPDKRYREKDYKNFGLNNVIRAGTYFFGVGDIYAFPCFEIEGPIVKRALDAVALDDTTCNHVGSKVGAVRVDD